MNLCGSYIFTIRLFENFHLFEKLIFDHHKSMLTTFKNPLDYLKRVTKLKTDFFLFNQEELVFWGYMVLAGQRCHP